MSRRARVRTERIPSDTVWVSTDMTVSVLSGLCAQDGRVRCVGETDGWMRWEWDGLRGGHGTLELRSPTHPDYEPADESAHAALARAAVKTRSLVELIVLLGRLMAADAVPGGWQLAPLTAILYGPIDGRHVHNADLKGWLALLERGRWVLDARTKAGRYGALIEAEGLVHVEQVHQSAATVEVERGLARAIKDGPGIQVPPEQLRIEAGDEPNPHGNRPSRDVVARTRLAAAVSYRFARGRVHPYRVSLEDLMVRTGGMSLAGVRARRRMATWFDVLAAELVEMTELLGVGIRALPGRAPDVVRTMLQLVQLSGPGRLLVAARSP